MKKKYTISTAINGMEIDLVDENVPEWICLIPAGKVVGRDGRAWINDQPEKIVENFGEMAMDLPVDIEHSTEHKAPKGEPAPAVGWIREIESRDGAIWGRVAWTASGKQLVGERAYRYISPVILYRGETKSIVGLTSAAVTNQPNLRLPALNQQQGSDGPKENTMLKALLAALGLSENATEAEAVAKVGTLQTDLQTATNRAENPSLEKFVPRADYDAALTKAANAVEELATIHKTELDKAVNQAIDKALEDGKITPATTDYHRAQCSQEGGLERFTEYCKTAPVIAGDSDLDTKKPDGKGKALNAQEIEVCTALGISEEDYRKTV